MKKFILVIFMIIFNVNYSADMEISLSDEQLISNARLGNFENVKQLASNASLNGVETALKEAKKTYEDLNKPHEQGGLCGLETHVHFHELFNNKNQYPKIIDLLQTALIKKDGLIAFLKNVLTNDPYSVVMDYVSETTASKLPSNKGDDEEDSEYGLPSPNAKTPKRRRLPPTCPGAPKRQRIN